MIFEFIIRILNFLLVIYNSRSVARDFINQDVVFLCLILVKSFNIFFHLHPLHGKTIRKSLAPKFQINMIMIIKLMYSCGKKTPVNSSTNYRRRTLLALNDWK